MEKKYVKVINAILGTNFNCCEIEDGKFLEEVSVEVLEKLDKNNLIDEDDWYYVSFNPNLTLDFILKNHEKLSFYSLIVGEYVKDDILKQIPSEIVLNSGLTDGIILEIDYDELGWKEYEHIFDAYPNFIDWEYLLKNLKYIFKNLEVDEEFLTKYSKYLVPYLMKQYISVNNQ
jgi:hypothetical protein